MWCVSTRDADLSTLDVPAAIKSSRGGEGDSDAELLPALTILYHPRLERIGDRALLPRLASGAAVHLSRLEPVFEPPRAGLGEPLGDGHLSRKPIRLLKLGDGRIRVEARDTPTRVVARGELLEGSRDYAPDELRAGVVIELMARVVLLLHLGEPGPSGGDDLGLVGESHAIERVRRQIRRLAELDVPVLIRGETGSGKELVAQALHGAGSRRVRPFVAVNMGAIPPSLAGAELFGAERGAFTGSVRGHAGYFGAAEEGTLFLDEIGETPLDVQAALLRALDSGEIQPLGAARGRRVRVRVVAATDADLEAKVRAGAFRAPLLHRLASYELHVPPLRERRDDVGRLFSHFLRAELGLLGQARRLEGADAGGKPWLPPSLVAALARHDWPGNVRQLRNVVRQIVVGSPESGSLSLDQALARLSSAGGAPAPRGAASADREPDPPAARAQAGRRKPTEVTEDELIEALRACRWDFKSTADRLRIARTSLYALVDACSKVRRASDLDPGDIERCYRECGGDVEQMASRLQVSKHALQRRIRELRLS